MMALYYKGQDIEELTVPELVEAIKELYANYYQLYQTLGEMLQELAKWQ